jgi:uncharacterized membrane protein
MEKNLQLDRLVFFCDAVVAIAITLLVFNLKLDHLPSGHLTFNDLAGIWPKLLAFGVSFLNIAIFWTIHHNFFSYIKKIDVKIRRYNLYWLFFIVTIPFSASLVSSYFSDEPAMLVYCANIFMITVFQNQIWDTVATHPDFLNADIKPYIVKDFRLGCNVAMINAALAIGISFFSPPGAFAMLLLRLPIISVVRRIKYRKAAKAI